MTLSGKEQTPTPAKSTPGLEERGPSLLFGLRTVALVEIVGFLAIAVVIDWLFFDGTRFWSVRPHPFWAIVVLVAVQYGANEGLCAAVASSIALLAWNLPAEALGTDVFDYWTEVGLRPALWIGVGQVLGQMRDRQLVERTRLRSEVAELKEQNRVIAESFETVKEAKAALEARIARQFRTVITTYRAVQSVDVSDPEHLEEGLDNFIETILSPKKFSHWRLAPGGFELERAIGWETPDEFDRSLDLNHPIAQHLLSKDTALCAARADDERLLLNQGLLAGLLMDADTGEIFGMFKIEDMGFLDFNLYSLENFNVMCSWISLAKSRSRRWQNMEKNRVTGMNSFIMTAEVFDRISDLLTQLGQRKGFESSLLSMSKKAGDQLTPELQSLFALTVGEAARSVFRSTDLAFEQQEDETGFTILLPGTQLEHAEGLATRFRDALEERLPGVFSIDQVEIKAQRVGAED